MAGVVPGFSLTTQFDQHGKPLPGCKLYVIQAGTVSTPQIAYQDSALTIPSPGGSQLTGDAFGRLPQFFLADGSIKFRLTDSEGSTVFTQDGLLVVGASSGGGGGSPVDPTSIIATGDIKVRYGTGVLTGFVRANARSIGSATSGATERANADCQALFEYLWTTDANLAVSTGRGVSANADWVANKKLTLPDWRGRAIAGLGDMGNTPTTALLSAYFGADPTVLGTAGGNQGAALIASNLPAHTHGGSGTTGNENANHTHAGSGTTGNQNLNHTHSGTTGNENADHTHVVSGTTAAETQNHTHTIGAGVVYTAGGGPSGITASGVSAGASSNAVVTGVQSANHNHTFSATSGGISANHQHAFTSGVESANHQHAYSFTTAIENASHGHAYSFTTDSGPGSSTPFAVVTPSMVTTIYLKL